jgi:predicted nucleotidyltransferase
VKVVGVPGDPNIAAVQAAFSALGDLSEQLVLVGGCATGLLVTSPRSEMIRPTRDVDVVIETVSRSEYRRVESQFRERGFTHDQSADAPICRWRFGEVIVDLMPTAPEILGFGNRWYPRAVELCEMVELPDGERLRLISAPLFLLTKFEALRSRAGTDLVLSHDLEDIVTVLDGRDSLEDEIAETPADVGEAIQMNFRELLEDPRAIECMSGFLPADAASQGRLPDLLARMRRLTG